VQVEQRRGKLDVKDGKKRVSCMVQGGRKTERGKKGTQKVEKKEKGDNRTLRSRAVTCPQKGKRGKRNIYISKLTKKVGGCITLQSYAYRRTRPLER